MKRTTLLVLSMLLTTSFLNAQANLVLSSGTTTTTSLKRGDHLNITFRVSNTGNVAAGKSHTSIYISPALSFTNATLLSEISCETLAAGQQTQDINFIYPLPYNIANGTNYIIVLVDADNEVVESNETNGYPFATTVNINSVDGGQQNLPYPVILIHGLSDNYRDCWDSLKYFTQLYYGFSFGGNMNFCLNQDGDVTTSNHITDYKDWTDTNSLKKADFYTINFSVDINGNYMPKDSVSILSNQSGIFKQGIAVRDAIKHVLKVTGRDKVILLCHSMGGLAARQYLQNSSFWQSDNQHHIAKLCTIGTPHGGSNSTFLGLAAFFGTPDERSEAIRDLRTSYTYSFPGQGVFLKGGVESYSTMRDKLLVNFYNVDVNCDGINNNGDSIKGLNQRSLPTNLAYSCVIGDNGNSLVLTGDGVVDFEKADLNTYYSINADTFVCQKYFSYPITKVWHSFLPNRIDYVIKGLDESNEYSTAYGIDTGRTYFANFSIQSVTGYQYDYDDYKITIPQNGLLNCKLYNIPTHKCYFNLLDSAQNIIYKDSTNGQAYYEFNRSINKGRYFVEFYTTPETDSWYYPYAFKLSLTPTLPLTLLDFTATLQDKKTLLRWTTTNEINTNKFDIERSINSTEWNTLGSVNSANLTGTNSYNFIDANTNFGINYYRLKMIDKDGSYTYSQIRTVEITKQNAPYVIAPNPAKSKTTIYFNTPIFKAQISIYDVQGKQVFINTYNETSLTKIDLNTSNFLSGVYIVSIKTNEKTYNEKLIVYK